LIFLSINNTLAMSQNWQNKDSKRCCISESTRHRICAPLGFKPFVGGPISYSPNKVTEILGTFQKVLGSSRLLPWFFF
jgi:hypothetical protein